MNHEDLSTHMIHSEQKATCSSNSDALTHLHNIKFWLWLTNYTTTLVAIQGNTLLALDGGNFAVFLIDEPVKNAMRIPSSGARVIVEVETAIKDTNIARVVLEVA
ncbi:hypothetical protein SELMODRAFT_416440 [Selaginella moellendorffii]|uniref:Uncharacterized protein n=1 Tax=Selaginella moellendorffii TaxID=88036 RepID=D8RZA2_SELML|nr:hypothetical protein SELMODRAFT_416440 [Selaginella moellendorffii]